jgi:hypothetical protein
MGKKPENKTNKKTKRKRNIPSSNEIHFQLDLQHAVLVQSLFHQRKRKMSI